MADARETWRPRLWVRCLATAVPALVASSLLYPHVLNPDWTDGTPTDEFPWLAGLVAAYALVVYTANVSKIVLDPPTLRIVNPWGVRTLQAAHIIAVEPGPVGVRFVTRDGRRHVALAVQCTRAVLGRRPRWVDVAAAVTGRAPRWQPEPPAKTAELAAQVEEHARLRGYTVRPLGAEDDGYLVFLFSILGRLGEVKIALNGEVFLLALPGGYTWPEFSDMPEEAHEALQDVLALLDAYADPRTCEVQVQRRFLGPRTELRLTNGAILRRRGWSRGPSGHEG